MSFDTLTQTRISSFRGKVATLLVEGRATNRLLGRGLILNAISSGQPCTVLDLDALYSSNSDFIFESLTDEEADSVELLIPSPGSDLQSETAQVLSLSPKHMLIVDSLNSLYHLFPVHGHSPRSRNLAFILAFLSYLARTEGSTVVVTKYRRAVEGRVSISDRSDYVASVTMRGNVLSIREERTVTGGGLTSHP